MLRFDAAAILGDELKTDNATIISKQTTISNDSNLGESALSDTQWLNKHITNLLATSSPIIFEYHKSEIENVNSFIMFILSLIKWVSLATIALVTLFVLLEKNTGAIVSLITGGIIDSILGVLVQLFNSTLKSKKSYFDAENDSSKFNKMLLLIQAITDQSKKDSVVVDILRKYFDVNDNKK